MAEKELWIEMVVRCTEHGMILRKATLNFLDRKDRQQIAKTAWWAMHNGHTMQTSPVRQSQ